MKILITTDWYKPVINGVVTSVTNLSEELTALGHDVRILTLSENRRSQTKGNVTYIGSLGVGKIYPDARLRAAHAGRYIKALIDWCPDIIHSQCEFSTFFLARKIAEACQCPLVHTYHTVYEDFTHYFSPNVRFGKLMTAAFSRRILANTQAVVAPTDKIKKMLEGYQIKSPISVIPSGLQLHAFTKNLSADQRNKKRQQLGFSMEDTVLIYLGRLAQEKNIQELLTFLSSINDPHLKLLLVGDGPYRSPLENLVDQVGLGNRVVFTGMVPPADVPLYYQLGDIFVSGSQSETQGLTYIEAMASGLPLLCREDPCLSGVVEKGINGLTYQTPDEFLCHLHRLINCPEYRRELGRAARTTSIHRFSSEGFAKNALALYRQQLQDHAAQHRTAKFLLSQA